MKKKFFFRDYITVLLFTVILLPSLSEDYTLANKIYSFGIIKVAVVLFIIGAIIDILLNKKESDFLSKANKFNFIIIILFFLILILKFNNFL